MRAERLREIASEMEAEIQAMPAPEDATSDREREERDQAIRAADQRRLVVARSAQTISKAEAELETRYEWRDALIEASRALEERLLAARAAAAASPPPRRRPGLPAGTAVEEALCAIDFYRCRACSWIGREPEAAVIADTGGGRSLGCPECEGRLTAPALIRSGASGQWVDPDALALLPPRPTWPAAPGWLDNERLIERLEARIAAALEQVQVATQGRRRRAA